MLQKTYFRLFHKTYQPVKVWTPTTRNEGYINDKADDTLVLVSYAGDGRLNDDNEEQKTDDTADLVSYVGNGRLKDDNKKPKSW